MVANNDIPYLEPLLFFLRENELLKKYFTDKSFFMPKHTLWNATEEALKCGANFPRALWILPHDTENVSNNIGCKGVGSHTFNVVIFLACAGNAFEIKKINNELFLAGQYMELSEIRKVVKDVMHEFSKKIQDGILRLSNLKWMRDVNIYPTDEDKFLSTAMEFNINIL